MNVAGRVMVGLRVVREATRVVVVVVKIVR